MPSPQRHLSVDELSQRASTGLAIRRGEIKISEPIPSSFHHNGAEMDGAFEQPQATPKLNGSWSRRSGAGTVHGRNESSNRHIHVSRFTERTSMDPSLTASNMSSTPSKDSIQRKTGLRASLRRMFSKKDKDAVIQPRSAIAPNHVLPMSASQPISEYRPSPLQSNAVTPLRALPSYATSPHLRVESVDVIRDQHSESQIAKRRNTLPDLLMTPCEQPLQAPQESQEAPLEETLQMRSPGRPATAIKRNTPPPPLQFNRRSRSADALADLLRVSASKTSDRRDRTEEIAFWRNSIVVDPLPSRPVVEKSSPSNASHARQLSSSTSARLSNEPMQDFDFELNDGSDPARPTTLQERVNTLEVKLFDFEYALAKLQGANITRPNLPKKPSGRGSLRGLFLESGESSSSTNDLSYLSSPSERWQPASPRARADRASRATTVKPAHRRLASTASQTSSHSSIRFTREQYDTLCVLIQDEKVARQQLEYQIMNLQKEVDILKSPIYAYVSPTKYPTPSPESSHDQPTPRLLRRSPPMKAQFNLNETSRFSMTETDTDAETEEALTELYMTPQENTFQFESIPVSRPRMI